MKHPDNPPYAITSQILHLVSEISAEIGRREARGGPGLTPALRRSNRLRTIHASLAIENNSLSLDQVTAVVSGRRVLGPPKKIHEVKNAFAAYEAMDSWQPWRQKDLLSAHRLLMQGLINGAGQFRSSRVGIAKGKHIVHIAPPAARVPELMRQLLAWLRHTDAHPLISSCVFYYELESIHPFSDGNGRIGRLWQTLILSRWNPLLAWLPVESVVRDRKADHYSILASCDRIGNSTPFIEFLLAALLAALRETQPTDQVTDQVTVQVKALLDCLSAFTLSATEIMQRLGLSHRPTFRRNYLDPALAASLIARSHPDKPNSRLQKYRRTTSARP